MINNRKRAERRFIPACAGNSRDVSVDVRDHAVHPRVCGEQVRDSQSGKFCTGSSPRVRGTEALPNGEMQYHRFIPACAGNSIQTPDG